MTPSPYTHPDWESLLKAVVASPDDDLPRLVAADWLDEHGDPDRGEFIRLQIERAKADHPRLALRERQLLNDPLRAGLWAVDACPSIVRLDLDSTAYAPPLSGTERVAFRRGFPFRVTCTAEEWLRHGRAIVPRQPVRELSLTRCDAVEIAEWWQMAPTLRLLARLQIDGDSLLLGPFLRDRICPGVQVCTAHGPVVDEIIS